MPDLLDVANLFIFWNFVFNIISISFSFLFFFWELHGTMYTSTHMHTHPLWTHVRKPYPYVHFRRIKPADLEIHEVTACTSLSTGTSSTTESITPVNPEINLGKYEHPCQIENLNLDGQIPPEGTQPTISFSFLFCARNIDFLYTKRIDMTWYVQTFWLPTICNVYKLCTLKYAWFVFFLYLLPLY